MLRATLYRRLVILGLVAAHVGLLSSIRQNFVVIDESAHIPSGLSIWRTGEVGLYRVNPPLSRAMAALPLLLVDPVLPPLPDMDTPGERPEFEFGRAFSEANASRYFDLVCLARLAGIGWSLLGAWLVSRWATELYGDRAGLLALALWCFEPTILAFAPVALPDLPATVAGLAATYSLWKYLRSPTVARACLVGVLLGIALLTKLTLLILCVVWPILWLVDRRFRDAEQPGFRLSIAAAQGVWIAMLGLLVVNSGYGFQKTGRPLRDFLFVSRAFAGPPSDGAGKYEYGASGNRFREWPSYIICPVPADYLLGIDSQRRDFEAGFRSYLRGTIRHRGWWYYDLYALAVKVPLGYLGLVLGGIVAGLAVRAGRRASKVAVWLPAVAIVAFVSIQTGFSHHLRYILPAFPYAIIGASKLGARSFRCRWMPSSLIVILWCWGTVSSLSVHPHQMAYFNELAGGPEGGHEYLLDSNLDWGQDLLFLKSWLKEHPQARPLGLAYYNYVDPRIVGIDFVPPPIAATGIFLDDREYQRRLGPHPGIFAVSANLVHGLSGFIPDGKGNLRSLPGNAYAFFRHFRPTAKAGHSLFIYHITLAEANLVRRDLGLVLLVDVDP